ncbi:MAG TPA: tetratricopeptide repeat protein [Nitrospirota bacterium]
MKTFRKKTGKKKDMLTAPDEFQSLSRRVGAYIQENTTAAYIVLGVVGVLLVAAILVSLMMRESSKEMMAKQGEALMYYDINSAVPGEKPMNADERMKKAEEMFGKMADKSNLALYYQANAKMELGNSKDAVGEYKKLLEKASGDKVMTALATMRLAAAYEETGDAQAAVDTYNKAANSPEALFKDEALYRQAEVYRLSGKKDEAIAKLNQLIKEFPDSRWKRDAQVKLAQLEGKPVPADENAMPISQGVAIPQAAPAGAGKEGAAPAGQPAPPAVKVVPMTPGSKPAVPAPAAPAKK